MRRSDVDVRLEWPSVVSVARRKGQFRAQWSVAYLDLSPLRSAKSRSAPIGQISGQVKFRPDWIFQTLVNRAKHGMIICGRQNRRKSLL